jgi:monofunctional biosynthetic peptidoglycan transglycosylase
MTSRPRARRKRSLLSRIVRAVITLMVVFYSIVVLSLVLLRWIAPVTTAVQIERRIEALMQHKAYRKSYAFVPLSQISANLQHAVIAAEDARFYQHHGFDWNQVQIAVKEDMERGRRRGASTITQQLVKNLFLGTSRSFLRKGVEFTIVPLTEALLSKQRILELYLNIIEWGPGIYAAQAASQNYFRIPASRLTREQSIGMAEVIPAPLRRKPGRLPDYGAAIEERMAQMRW